MFSCILDTEKERKEEIIKSAVTQIQKQYISIYHQIIDPNKKLQDFVNFC